MKTKYKVTILQEETYIKSAEIEIFIPKDVTDVADYLLRLDEKWADDLQDKVDKAPFVHGNSIHEGDYMPDSTTWRYDCEELNIGGKL